MYRLSLNIEECFFGDLTQISRNIAKHTTLPEQFQKFKLFPLLRC